MADQLILQFSVMFMFAASLLSLINRNGNFSFELVAAKGTGKTTLQRLMSSVCGGAGHGGDGHYYEHFDTTLNALEHAMAVHSDLPLVLEEANLFVADAPARTRAAAFKALAFKLSGGSTKNRLGAPNGRDVRLLSFISANDCLASLIGEDSEGATVPP